MSRWISVGDVTMKQKGCGSRLSFREKIELAKKLDSLRVSVIEMDCITEDKADGLLVKSVAAAVGSSTLAVPVDIMDVESVSRTWAALKQAVHPRLQVVAPVSTVQMEYFCHKKPDVLLSLVSSTISSCASFCPEVEFVAEDFTRSDEDFLARILDAAVEAGASTVTLCDRVGDLLPEEFGSRVSDVRGRISGNIRLGVCCDNGLRLADACAVASIKAGADEIKTTVGDGGTASLETVAGVLSVRAESFDIRFDVKMTELQHSLKEICRMLEDNAQRSPAAAVGMVREDDDIRLTAEDSLGTVLAAVRRLGYELGEEDCENVYSTFLKLARKNGVIEAKELEAIVATAAYQVPPTYRLESYVINTGNILTATCHLRLRKGDSLLENVCVGDGPVDAAFLAVEKAVSRHYDLDDFQIRSVTEGREALGEAVVRLRCGERVFSGRGISTDIIGSSIMAYLNAVNKIAYEEEGN